MAQILRPKEAIMTNGPTYRNAGMLSRLLATNEVRTINAERHIFNKKNLSSSSCMPVHTRVFLNAMTSIKKHSSDNTPT